MNVLSIVTSTTVTSLASIGLGTRLSNYCIIFLIGLLILKELLDAYKVGRQKFILRSVNIAIIPLLMSVVVIVVLKIVEILK